MPVEKSTEEKLELVSLHVLKSCVRVRPGDVVVVLFDKFGHDIAQALAVAASNMELDNFCARLVPFKEQLRCSRTHSLPAGLRESIRHCSVLISALTGAEETTSFRLQALTLAVKARAKIVHMPGVSASLLISTTTGLDFASMHRAAVDLKRRLNRASHVDVMTSSATGEHCVLHIYLSPSERVAHYCGGLAQPGEIMNIPTGEVYVAPVEYRAQGDIVINGSAVHCVFRGEDQVVLHFEEGVVSLKDSKFASLPNAQRLLAELSEAKREGNDNLALGELGIGLNKNLRNLSGYMLSDEKAASTAHIALGSNLPFGGKLAADRHYDLVFRPVRMLLDGMSLRLPAATIGRRPKGCGR